MAVPQSEIDAAVQRIESMQGGPPAVERSTSAAKDIQPVQGTTLDQAPDVQQAYGEAQVADQPLEQHPAQEPTPVSAAKEIAPEGLKGTSLDAAPPVNTTFVEATTPIANDNMIDQEVQGQSGSTMVEESRPHPYPAPEGPDREAVDREIFDQKWEEEQARADAHQAEIEAAAERAQAMEAQYEQDHSHDPGMEM